MSHINRNPEYRNYDIICAGIRFLEEKLLPYTERKLQETHQDVYKKMAGMPVCTQQCSVNLSNQQSNWCPSCKGWKTHLLKSRNRSAIVTWAKMKSDEWSNDFRQIVGIYLPESWAIENYQDLSTACQIWSNLKSCKIKYNVIQRIRTVRNKYVAHNTSHSADNHEKATVFDALRDLFKDMDVANYINTQDCLQGISKIENGVYEDKQLSNIEIDLQNKDSQLTNIEKDLHNKDIQLSKIERQVQDIRNNQENQRLHRMTKRIEENKKGPKLGLSQRGLMICWPIFYGLLSISILYYLSVPGEKQNTKECISEQYSIPFRQDLPLLQYIHGQSLFIGREWLFNDLHRYILTNSTESNINGVILTAEMGYGKSAIMSELICPKNTQRQVQELRQHVIGFHVCKFDVRSTHDPGRLIRRLVGFLSMKSIEFGNIVSMLPDSSLLYDKEGCTKEPEACFDQGITFPLQKLKDIDNPPWIFALDGLDECATSGQNDILLLLSGRIRKIPKWLKFVITSRNTTSLSRFRKIKLEYLSSDDQRNKDDIKTYISHTLPESPSKTRFIADLLTNSDGNFVYIVQAVNWLLSTTDPENLPKLPAGLDSVYEINFDRQFRNSDLYHEPKKILEIVCSTLNPLGKTDIFAILKGNGLTFNETDFEKFFNTLLFFLNVENGVRLKHQTLFYWLTNETHTEYRISLQEGHRLISTYLLNMNISEANGTVDIVDLTIHVGNSGDSRLKKIFMSSASINKEINSRDNNLHKLIWKTSSLEPLDLMLKHVNDIDKLNTGNVTASFVAASKGHVEQLQLMHKQGADIAFHVDKNFVIYAKHISDQIEYIKHVHYPGYNLLHIAVQHGHLHVVLYLLQHKPQLLSQSNSLGLNPGLVACESGHMHIIKEMFKLNSKLFGFKCLYYASKHNHRHVVEWLVSLGVKLKCISDQTAIDAFHESNINFNIENRKLALTPIITHTDRPLRFTKPLDNEWIFFKFNSLIEAIRKGSLNTAAYLIDSFPEALDCRDGFGFSVALLSVVFNRTELFPRLINRIMTDKCGILLLNDSHYHLTDWSGNYICPEGGNVAHILALYPVEDQLIYFVRNHFSSIHWNTADKQGNYPIHYAVSNNNLLFIHFMRKRFNVMDVTRTSNGSSPYHIAVKAGNMGALFALSDSFNFPQLEDNNQQSILHHLVQISFTALTASGDQEKQDISFYTFKKLVENSHDLMARDSFGRNILHYALKFGHYKVIAYLLQEEQKAIVNALLSQKDVEGHRPIEYAVKEYQRDKYGMVNMYSGNCPYYEVYSEICTSTYEQLMSSWEIALLFVIDKMSDTEVQEYLEPLMSYIWLKSSYLMTAVIQLKKYYNENILRSLVMQSEVSGVTKYNQFMIAYDHPSIYHVCGESLLNSPLHYLMLHAEFKDTLFGMQENYHFVTLYAEEADINFIFHLLFSKSKNVLNCKDKNGFNIFHYALMGGNVSGARLFLNNGIEIFDKHVSIRTILLMALQAPLRSVDNYNYGCWYRLRKHVLTSQEACTDVLLVDILNSHALDIVATDICYNGSKELSPIHLLISNGMLETVKLLVNRFSSSILNCRNEDGFSTLYLAMLFSNHEIVSFIQDQTKLAFPNQTPELVLLIYIYGGLNMRDTDVRSMTPFICSTMFSTPYIQNKKWYHCTKSVLEHLGLVPMSGSHLLDAVEYMEYCVNNLVWLLRRYTDCPDILIRYNPICISNISIITGWINVLRVSFAKDSNVIRFKHIIRLLHIVNVRYNNTMGNRDCADSNLPKWHFGSLLVTLRGFIRFIRLEVRNIAIHSYLKGIKVLPSRIPHEYQFLQQRFGHFHIKNARLLTDQLVPIDRNVILNFNHFSYLQIIRSTLSYKKLKNQGPFLSSDYFTTSKVYRITEEQLIEPFKDLE